MFNDLFDLRVTSDEERNKTRIAMLDVDDTHIEFLSTSDETTRTGQFIAKNGHGYFHLCLEVENLSEAMDELRTKGVRFLTDVPITGHGGSRVAFLDPASTGGMLLELLEPASA